MSALFNGTFSNQPTLGAVQTSQGIWLATGDTQDVTINSAAAQVLTITGNATLNSQLNAGIYMNDSANHNLTIGPNTSIALTNNTGFYNQESSASTLTISGGLNLGVRALTIGLGATSTGNVTINSVISGTTGTITVNSAGAVTLSGTNTYTGNTLITAGTVTLTNNLALQNSAVDTTGAGTITLSGTNTPTIGGLIGSKNLASVITSGASGVTLLTVNPFVLAAYNTYSGVIANLGSGAMSLTKNGSGTQVLSGANTYTGATTVSAGILVFSNTGAKSSGTTVTAAAAGSIGLGVGAVSGDYSDANVAALFNTNTLTGFSLAASSGVAVDTTAGNFTQSTALTAARALTKLGANTLTLNGTNTYNGATTVSGGTLVLGGTNSSAGTTAASTGGILQLANTTATNGGLASGTLFLSGGTLQATSVSPLTISNVVTLNTSSTVSGNQSLTFNGSLTNTSGGRTLTNNISAGNTLVLTGPVYLSESASTARTMNLSGTGNTTVNGAISNFNGAGLAGGLSTAGGGIITLNGNNTYTGTTTIGVGTVILNGTTTSSSIGLNSPGAVFTESVTGVISGGSLAVGTGTTGTLAGNNTYSGGTTLNTGTGTLNINSATALGTGTFTIGTSVGASGTINNTSAAAVTLTNNNVQAWNSDFTFTGTKDLNLGTGAVTMNASRQVTVNGGNLTVGGAISGLTFGLSKAGAGTLALSGANTFTGSTTITLGTLQLGNGGATGSLSTSSAISLTGNLTINRNNAVVQGADFSSAAITGTGNFLQAGTGTTTLNAANTYSGNTTVSAGTLQFAKTQALYNSVTASWTAAKIPVASGGTLAFNVGGTGEFSTGNVTTLLTNLAASTSSTNGMAAGSILGFDTTNASGANFTIGDVIANTTGATGGARGLTKLGANTLTLTNTNTYTGATTISAGTLQIGSGSTTGALSASSAITNNGNLTFNRSSAVVQGTDFSSTGISGTGSLTQAGSGDLTLNVTNSYSGATTVSSGTLILSATLSNSAVTVSGGTLKGTGTATQGITMTSGTLAPGNSPGLLAAGSLTLSGGTTAFEINGTARGSTFDAIDITAGGGVQFGGAFTIAFSGLLASGTTLDLFNFTTSSTGDFSSLISTGTYAGTWTRSGEVLSLTSGAQTLSFSEITGDLNVVPEPATWALLAFSLTTVMVLRRRRRE